MRIKCFSISKYRSLCEFSVPEFEPTTVFYGENNVGKSNVLNALYMIFKRKRVAADEPGKFSQPKNFYSGIIEKFSNNFYNNESGDITFNVELSVDNSELTIEEGLKKKLIKGKANIDSSIIFEGNISRSNLGKDYAEIFLTRAVFNGITIYQHERSHGIAYFPSIDKTGKNQSVLAETFSKLVEPFNDCVAIIESSRDMLPTKFNEDEIYELITPSNFKHFLHDLYMSEDGHETFEEINRVFSSEPFKFGSISFSKDHGDLEIMIKNNGIRLPIKHIGSGVLQSLYVIARAIHTKGRILCVEELEQNLSPTNQYNLIAKLKSMIQDHSQQGIDQLIISSHSTVYAEPKLGAIYMLEMDGHKTSIKGKKEKVGGKLSNKLREHLIFAALPERTYSVEEWKLQEKRIHRLNEEGFHR
jgi:predicted ATPase